MVASPVLSAVGTTTYYAESVQNVTACTSSTRTAVILTIQPTPAAPASGGDITECEANPIQTLTATATAPAGSNVVWYDAASNGNIVASPTLNTIGTITYYAESQNATTSCVSDTDCSGTYHSRYPNYKPNAWFGNMFARPKHIFRIGRC